MDVDLQALDGPLARHLQNHLRRYPVGYSKRDECPAAGMGTHLVAFADCLLDPVLAMVAHKSNLRCYSGKAAESLQMAVHLL